MLYFSFYWRQYWFAIQTIVCIINFFKLQFYVCNTFYKYGILQYLNTTKLFESATMKNYGGWKKSSLSLTVTSLEYVCCGPGSPWAGGRQAPWPGGEGGCQLCLVNSKQCAVCKCKCKLCQVHSLQWTVHVVIYSSAYFTEHRVECTLYTIHRKLQIVHCKLCSVNCTL